MSDDNGNKLRNGVSWDANRYKGAWIENANSYQAVTKALTGTYATAGNYNKMLDSRIATYDLTQYDPKIWAIITDGYTPYFLAAF